MCLDGTREESKKTAIKQKFSKFQHTWTPLLVKKTIVAKKYKCQRKLKWTFRFVRSYWIILFASVCVCLCAWNCIVIRICYFCFVVFVFTQEAQFLIVKYCFYVWAWILAYLTYWISTRRQIRVVGKCLLYTMDGYFMYIFFYTKCVHVCASVCVLSAHADARQLTYECDIYHIILSSHNRQHLHDEQQKGIHRINFSYKKSKCIRW